MIFETDKHERLTELGLAIDIAMAGKCAAMIAHERDRGMTYRNIMVSVSRCNPFTVKDVQLLFPNATGITQIDLDSLWLGLVFDACLSAII